MALKHSQWLTLALLLAVAVAVAAVEASGYDHHDEVRAAKVDRHIFKAVYAVCCA
jgi:hypothetical protein